MHRNTKLLGYSVTIIVLSWLTLIVLTTKELRFLDGVNLIFHEAGHWIFFAPHFLNILGGTLGQLLVPFICGVAFWRERKFVSLMIMMWWSGQNLINISVYASDARARVLPLLGGDGVGHDWSNIFSTLGLLEYDTMIGSWIFFIGACVMAFSILQIALHTYAMSKHRFHR